MPNDLPYFTFQNIRDGPKTKFGLKYLCSQRVFCSTGLVQAHLFLSTNTHSKRTLPNKSAVLKSEVSHVFLITCQME